MKEPAEIPETGVIHCDNPSCDYTLDNVKYADLHNHIHSECPKCGEVLITEQDYMSAMTMIETLRLINTLSPDELDILKQIVPGGDIEGFAQDQITTTDERKRVLFNSRSRKFEDIPDAETIPDSPETDV